MITEELQQKIKEALSALGVEAREVLFEHPAELSHGDFSTNIALVYAKELKVKPRELGEKIVEKIQDSRFKIQGIQEINVAGPGFINFHLTPGFFSGQVAVILREGDSFGKNEKRKGQKIFFEYTQPNPFKEFHIGHLMNNTIGEAVSRALEWSGATVKRATYHGDVGLHVAKSMWGLRKLGTEDIDIELLGQAYAEGNRAYEEGGMAKTEITDLNRKIYEKTDSAVNTLYETGKRISLAYFEDLYKRLDSTFDFHFFESEAGEIGRKIVEEHIGTVFERSEGAVVYKGEKHGLHTRVFLNSEGLPTYEAKEIGLARLKDQVFDSDSAITVTANEQNDFFKVVEKVIGEVFPRYDGKMRHLSHGTLRLPSGKMSSRMGTIISAESLIAQVKELVQEKIREREMTADEKEKLSEIVAIGAIKYSILRQSVGGDIIFDLEKSISFEGDSGPYLQYSYVRARSVLKKAEYSSAKPSVDIKYPQEGKVGWVERLVYRFPEVVERAGTELEPHHIVTYLTELAGEFNGWYAHNKVIGSGTEEPYRLALTQAFATVMKNGLSILGIKAPEKM